MLVSGVPDPSAEAARLEALSRYAILDTPAEAAFDRLVRLAARLFQVPTAFVAFADHNRLWFKAQVGISISEGERSSSFCTTTILTDDVLVVLDAAQDERFRHSPLVTERPGVRFYAGAPLILPGGERVGTLCLFDTQPRDQFTAQDCATLQDLAASVVSELELRRALSDRQEAEAVNAAILTAVPDAVVTLNDQGMITEWNPAAEEMFGQTRAEAIGQSSREYIHEMMGEEASREFWSFLQTQPVAQPARDIQAPVRVRGGRVFPAETTILSMDVQHRRFYTMIVRDRTLQAQAQAELRSQHNLLRATLDGVPEAMFVKDLERRYLMINAAGARHLRLPTEAILGRTDEDLFPADVAQAARLHEEEVLSSGQALAYEVTDEMPDGRVIDFLSNKSVYRDSAGEIAGLIGVALDITERKAAEAAIRRYSELLSQKVEDAQTEILERLASAAEYRDDDTGEHMMRVGVTAATLAQALGLPERDVQLLRRTAPLHDVGKVGIPDSLLLKPGRLEPEEFEVVKTHAQIGAALLRGGTSELVKMAETIAHTHHERWDGAGYPRGLRGTEIPVVGRIVAVADVLDALTSNRPYKRAWGLDQALAEIAAQSGRQFDPEVVEALLQLYGRPQVDGAQASAGLD